MAQTNKCRLEYMKESPSLLSASEFLELMFDNGYFPISSPRRATIYDKPAPKPKEKTLPYNHPISKNKRGEISNTELCKILGIKDNELIAYLIT